MWYIQTKYVDEYNIILKEFLKTLKKNILYQIKNNEPNFNTLERFVYNIANYHLKRLNLDINSHNIEFGVINEKKYNFHKKEGKSPIVSGVVFLEDNVKKEPVIVTNLDDELYKFKEFSNININCIFPKKLAHILFEPYKYYYNIQTENILLINIWNKTDLNSVEIQQKEYLSGNYYLPKNNILINDTVDFKKKEYKVINVEETESSFNYDYFDALIYLDVYNYKLLTKLIKTSDYEKYDSFQFRLEEKKSLSNPNKNFNEKNRINTKPQKFIQRFIVKQIYQRDICNWIISQSEEYAIKNGGWTTTRHKQYPTTDLPVNNMKNVFSFISHSFQDIVKTIKQSYCLNDSFIYNVSDMFIVKYDTNMQSELEIHTDDSDISVNILLSDPSDFAGGGTHFDDGITTNLEKGGMLIHSGCTKHSGLKITGVRYILVAFIKIYNGN